MACYHMQFISRTHRKRMFYSSLCINCLPFIILQNLWLKHSTLSSFIGRNINTVSFRRILNCSFLLLMAVTVYWVVFSKLSSSSILLRQPIDLQKIHCMKKKPMRFLLVTVIGSDISCIWRLKLKVINKNSRQFSKLPLALFSFDSQCVPEPYPSQITLKAPIDYSWLINLKVQMGCSWLMYSENTQ